MLTFVKRDIKWSMGGKTGVDANLTFDPEGHVQGYKIYQFFAKLAYHSSSNYLTQVAHLIL